MSQPPLSVAVQELERIVGRQLLVRDRRGVLLTEAGEKLAVRARRLLDEAAEIESGLDEYGESSRSALEIAVPLDTQWDVVERFRSLHREHENPRELVIRERSTASQLRRLGEGTQDIGVVYLPADLSGLDVGATLSREFGLAFRSPHPAEAVERVDPAALGDLIFLFPRAAAPGYYDAVVAGLGNPVKVDRAVDPIDAMLKHGSGMALAPEGIDAVHREVLWRPVDPPLIVKMSTVSRASLDESARGDLRALTTALVGGGWRLESSAPALGHY
jgi:Transcriptional regulator